MRTAPILAGVAMVLVAAGAAMAASPSPSSSPSATTKPSPTAKPSPSTGSGSSSTPASGESSNLTASILPLDVTTGSVTLASGANGTGTLTLTLKGLRPEVPWTVDVDGGTLAGVHEVAADEIAFRSGMGIDRVSSDTIRIHLTASEMKAFAAARSSIGVVVLVSDGANRAAASFAAG